MKIYTKTGDTGETGLFGGERVQKNHARIEAYGTLDELNAFVGLLRDAVTEPDVRDTLFEVQNRLFSLGAYLATPPKADGTLMMELDIRPEDTALLETAMDAMDATLEPLRNFILPGGHITVSYAHVARTVCRRAERLCVTLQQTEALDARLVQYLNRLSDYCFVLARYLTKTLGATEVTWKGR